MASLSSDGNQPLVIGVDVGGTKIAAALVDSHGNISGYQTCRTDISSPQATFNTIAQTVELVIAETGVSRSALRGVGLGIPGLVDPQHGIGIASVNLGWENVEVIKELEKRIGIACVIENDVKAAALGELRYGAGKGAKNLIYLNIGTGVAAAVILEGKIYRGEHGIAGEIGHAVIDPSGPLCKCGGHGCLEAVVSGPAIVSRAIGKAQAYPDSAVRRLMNTKPELTSQDIFQAAAQKDPPAVETVDEVSRYLSIAIQYLALAYDPHLILLGGGVVYSAPDFLDHVMEAIHHLSTESWVIRQLVHPDFIQVSKLGINLAILGAAALVP